MIPGYWRRWATPIHHTKDIVMGGLSVTHMYGTIRMASRLAEKHMAPAKTSQVHTSTWAHQNIFKRHSSSKIKLSQFQLFFWECTYFPVLDTFVGKCGLCVRDVLFFTRRGGRLLVTCDDLSPFLSGLPFYLFFLKMPPLTNEKNSTHPLGQNKTILVCPFSVKDCNPST